ncbi:MAG: hypothetical protein IJD92_05615 [Bacilli bacterium]|nr:hypothetical protein [Bacilli bacterium]
MINSIFNSFGRTLGRILCYIFIAFILFIIFSSMKGDINIWEIIKENLLF